MDVPPAVARRRVLVVDDEPQNLDTFRRVWRRYYDIEIAGSGEAGLALLASQEFDVVLTDYGMPGMNGAEFVKQARQRSPVAMVMLTGYMDKPEVRELEDAGQVFAVLGKPWERAVLLDVVERASQHTRAARLAARR